MGEPLEVLWSESRVGSLNLALREMPMDKEVIRARAGGLAGVRRVVAPRSHSVGAEGLSQLEECLRLLGR